MIRTLTTHWLLSYLGDLAQANAWLAHARRVTDLVSLRSQGLANARFCHTQAKRMLAHWRTCIRPTGKEAA